MPFSRRGRGKGWKQSRKRGTWRRKRYHGVTSLSAVAAMKRINARLGTRRGQRFHRKAWKGGSRKRAKYPRTMGARLNRPFKGRVAPLTLRQFPSYVPRVTRWVGVFTDRHINVDIDQGFNYAARNYRLNSPYDPRWWTGAGQTSVKGWDLMSLLYTQYRVYKCDVSAEFFRIYNTTAQDEVAWAQGQVMYMFLGQNPAATAVNREELAYAVLDGLPYTFGDNRRVSEHLDIMRSGGSLFPGYNKIKRLNENTIGDPAQVAHAAPQFGIRRLYHRLAMSIPIYKLAGPESSWTQFKANELWTGATMTQNPVNQRYINIGWRNLHWKQTSPVGVHAAGEMHMKMKMHMLLMTPKRVQLMTLTDAVEPVPVAPAQVGNTLPPVL